MVRRGLKISIILGVLLVICLVIIGVYYFIMNKAAGKFDPRVKTIYTQIVKSNWNVKVIDKYTSPQLRKGFANNPEAAAALIEGMNSLGPIKEIKGMSSFKVNYGANESAVLTNVIIFDKGARLFATRLVKVHNNWYLDAFDSYVLSEDLKNITAESLGTYILGLNKNDLGVLYASGAVLPKNTKKAISLFFEASAEGYTTAMFNIGVRYYKGNSGLPKDYSKAINWYQKVISNQCKSVKYCQGKLCAAHALGMIYLNGDVVKKNTSKARDLFKKSVDFGLKYNDISKSLELTDKDKSQIATKYAQYMLLQANTGEKLSSGFAKEKQLNAGIHNYCWD